MRFLRRFLIFFLIFKAGILSAQTFEIPGSKFGFGNWQGAAYYEPSNGGFSHCVISASYVSGDLLLFSITRGATVVVGVSNSNHRFETGQRIPVALYVDRRAPIFGTAVAQNLDFATLEIPDFDRALDAFKRGRVLTVEGAGIRGVYDLTGTFRALEAARLCAVHNLDYAALAQKGGKKEGSEDYDRTLLFQVSAEIISELQVKGFRYLTLDENINQGFPRTSVFWEAPDSGISGGVLVAPFDGNGTLRDTDASDTKFLASLCEGDFASSAYDRSNNETDIRELRVVCQTPEGFSETYATKILFGKEVLYMLLSFNEAAALKDSGERQSINEMATLRAAKFALD